MKITIGANMSLRFAGIDDSGITKKGGEKNNDPEPFLIDIFSACIYLFLCVFIDPRSISLNKWIA